MIREREEASSELALATDENLAHGRLEMVVDESMRHGIEARS